MTRLTRRRTKGIGLLALAFAAVVALAACGTGSSGGSSKAGGGSSDSGPQVLKWAGTWTVADWDPVVAGGTRTVQYLDLIYDSLTVVGSNGQPQPEQAESWSYNAAGDAVTFKLRPGLKFTDGSPVDAAAWKFNIERSKTQKNSQLAGDMDSIKSVDVIDDLTFRVNLTQVDYDIPALFGARGAGLIASEQAVNANLNTLDVSAPVGSGPYKVESLVPEASLTLVKNPDYWDAKDIHITRIEVTFNNDPNAIVQGIQTGSYNFAVGDVNNIDAAKKANLQVLDDYGYGYQGYFLPVNIKQAPFNNPNVVEALHYAINNQEFVSKAGFGYAEATDEPYPSSYPAYDPALKDQWPYDPDKAKQLLASAGYNTTTNRIKLPFVTLLDQPAVELIQAQLAAVGIDISIKVDPNWSKSFFAKSLGLTNYSYAGRDSFEQTFTANFGGGPLNLSGYQSPDFLAALAKVRQTPLDSPNLPSVLKAATDIGVKTSPNVYTYSTPRTYVLSPKISPLPKYPGQVVLKGVTISS